MVTLLKSPVQTWSSVHAWTDTTVELLLDNPAIYLDELQRELRQHTGTWTSISRIFAQSAALDSLEKC